ncbi:hypothetical protein FU139_27220 [Burkholderia territorii]|nr:hypothetical protein FU139_27220 [Burkholderia territorii]
MHAHGWHGRSARRRAPRVPGAAAAKRRVSGAAWRTGVMSNGVVVRDRRTAILAIGRWKCISMQRMCDARAGFAANLGVPFNKVMLYSNRANNACRFPTTGRRSRLRVPGGRPVTVPPERRCAVSGRRAPRSR